MKIIIVNKPFQDEHTKDKQEVNGEFPNWCVRTDASWVNESLKDWINRKAIQLKKDNIEGIYLYDVESLVLDLKSSALHIRYDYIKPNKQ